MFLSGLTAVQECQLQESHLRLTLAKHYASNQE